MFWCLNQLILKYNVYVYIWSAVSSECNVKVNSVYIRLATNSSRWRHICLESKVNFVHFTYLIWVRWPGIQNLHWFLSYCVSLELVKQVGECQRSVKIIHIHVFCRRSDPTAILKYVSDFPWRLIGAFVLLTFNTQMSRSRMQFISKFTTNIMLIDYHEFDMLFVDVLCIFLRLCTVFVSCFVNERMCERKV